jgi:hypothetical protein
MRLHFLVSTYLNLYIWDPITKNPVLGNPILNKRPSISDKKSHLITFDKLVAEMYVGDTFLE